MSRTQLLKEFKQEYNAQRDYFAYYTGGAIATSRDKCAAQYDYLINNDHEFIATVNAFTDYCGGDPITGTTKKAAFYTTYIQFTLFC